MDELWERRKGSSAFVPEASNCWLFCGCLHENTDLWFCLFHFSLVVFLFCKNVNGVSGALPALRVMKLPCNRKNPQAGPEKNGQQRNDGGWSEC